MAEPTLLTHRLTEPTRTQTHATYKIVFAMRFGPESARPDIRSNHKHILACKKQSQRGLAPMLITAHCIVTHSLAH